MPFVIVLLVFLLLHCATGENQKRIILHSGDDVSLEFQKLRREMDTIRNNYTQEIQIIKKEQLQEIEALMINHTGEIKALKTALALEIEGLMTNHTQEINALKVLQKQENEVLRSNFTKGIQTLNSELESIKKDQGSTYIRWGKTACAGNGTKKVYSGFTSGSPYDVDGGGASYVCLPEHPTWAKYMDGIQNLGGYISGTEYELYVHKLINSFLQNVNDQDAPCVLCRSPRPTTVMIPGRVDCYPGWAMEYNGYLMTDYGGHNASSDYACVDGDPEAVFHGEANQNGKLLYYTEVKCGSLPCQVYPDGRELACVVC